jgi:ubiquinone/menaquinone biosynthesis C-methylase UbiE
MHRMRNEPRNSNGPETTGTVLHWASEYDFFTSLLGMGANGPNSRMVVELAQIRPGASVLDVGCGTGNLTLTAQTALGNGGKAYGIDASPEMIERARKKAARAGSSVVFEVGLIEKMSFPDATFDRVISRLVIHHLPDDLKMKGFAEILRVLKPGGQVLFADFMQPRNPVLSHLAGAMVGSHMMQTSVWSMPPMLEKAGFMDVTSGLTRSAFLAYVRGRKAG